MIKKFRQKVKKWRPLWRKSFYILIFILILAVLLIIAFASYSIFYKNQLYFGLKAGDQSIAGLSIDESSRKIEQQSEEFLKKNLRLISEGEEFNLQPTEISLNYNAKESAQLAFKYGRSDNLPAYWDRLKLIFVRKTVIPVYQYNDESLNQKIDSIAAKLDQPEKDITLLFTADKAELQKEQAEGRRVNQEKLKLSILNRVEEFNQASIEIQIETIKPSVTEENAVKTLARAQAILDDGDIVLKYQDKNFPIDKQTIAGLITTSPAGSDLLLDINREKVKDNLKTIALSIDVGAEDAVLAVTNGQVVVKNPSRSGATVDLEATSQKVVSALLGRANKENSEPVSLEVDIIYQVSAPSITAETLSTLGLTALIGSGTTSFTGSPVNRVSNITVGARLLNGALIKPGETFSTLGRLGKIDASSGFLPELVIKENRTIPEYGGGLCQVSTTLFRAALNSGQKIIERQNHRYRVSYYEPPVGMDATIYDPAPDFKFINNTSGYILIQSRVSGYKITFEFYGTKDARIISISDPTISDITPPVPPIMEPTDTLPTGEQKQVEKPHDGATSSFNYLVTLNGVEIAKNTFVSRYVPWPARFLVGTGPVAPAPTPPVDPAAVPVPPPST